MTDINRAILVGKLTRGILEDQYSFSYLQNGTARAIVHIAVNRSKKINGSWTDEVSFFDVILWGKQAENLKPYLNKGQQIVVDGYLKQEIWEKDGKKNYKVSIIADSVQLLGNKVGNQNDNANTNSNSSINYQYASSLGDM